jgi:uncharacterized RDD family membrane protein YckC
MEYTMSPVDATPVSTVENSAIRYAGFWRRFVAFVLDSLILSAVFGMLMFIFGIGMWSASSPMQKGNYYDSSAQAAFAGAMMSTWMIYFVGSWFYFALMESSKNQGTLGKMALGLRVSELDGHRISFGRATGRYFAKILSTMTLMIGYIMAAFTSKKQALHDFVAGTMVLSKQSTVSAQVAANAYSGS